MDTFGDWTKVKPVTLKVIKMCLEVRTAVEEKVGEGFKIYIPVVYRSQIVNGKNYLVKVMVDEEGVCAHVNIYQTLPCYGGKLSVTGIEFPNSFDHPLVPFLNTHECTQQQ